MNTRSSKWEKNTKQRCKIKKQENTHNTKIERLEKNLILWNWYAVINNVDDFTIFF